jgi:flagellin
LVIQSKNWLFNQKEVHMSDIVLSASVRQNLLSLQSTADLLSTTQNRLATGKKVNTALDNPTNFFTAASLDNRANDINNLLDGIGNGVQVLQAANTGISSFAEAGRYREVDCQPGSANDGRLLNQVDG